MMDMNTRAVIAAASAMMPIYDLPRDNGYFQHPPKYAGSPAKGYSYDKRGAARATINTGRNEQCPCLSGKKYKHCHLLISDVDA